VEWVLVASSTPVLLFYQVALDRMDSGHVGEVFQTLIPFVVLWGMQLVGTGDALLIRLANRFSHRWKGRGTFPFAVPFTFLAVIAIAFGSPNSLTSWKLIPSAFHATVPDNAPSSLPLGYTLPGAVDTAQILDLGKVLDRYAGRSGPVFDFTNEMGVTYFLLNRVPGARFYHVESAQTAKAQNLEVGDLERSRPRVVIFNDDTYGLPDYDGIWSMERNYIVSQYLLDNYRPLLETHGQLVMLRNDLITNDQPLPQLSTAPTTSGLYFDMPSCNWGYVPNFLVHPTNPKGGLTVRTQSGSGIENLVTVSGWAFDTPDGQPTREVMAVSGNHVVGTITPSLPRTDVAAAVHSEAAASSGFQIQFPIAAGSSFRIYVLNTDGSVTPVAPTEGFHNSTPIPSSVTTPDGVVHPVRMNPSEGSLDSTSKTQPTRLFTLRLPPGTDLASYQWMELLSPSGFAQSNIELTDHVQDGPSHSIALSTLPSVGKSVYTRVGSCLQWHGYTTTDLTLLVNGPPRTLSVRLLK
jgi:hypothetical protein